MNEAPAFDRGYFLFTFSELFWWELQVLVDFAVG